MLPNEANEAEWEDDQFDNEDYGAEEWDDQDHEPTVPCPYCGREIYEDSVRCPNCGAYISDEDAPPGRKPWWIIIGVLLCLAAMLLWVALQ